MGQCLGWRNCPWLCLACEELLQKNWIAKQERIDLGTAAGIYDIHCFDLHDFEAKHCCGIAYPLLLSLVIVTMYCQS